MSDASVIFEQAVSLHRAGRRAEALTLCDRLLAAEPRDAAALHLSALLLYDFDLLPDAIARIERSLASDATDPNAWSDAGALYDAARRPRDAMRAFERAVSLAPGLAGAWLNLSSQRMALDDYVGAEDAARRAVGLAGAPGARFNLALALAAQGRHAEALRALEELDGPEPGVPSDPGPAGLRAQQLVALGRRDEARSVLDDALAHVDDPLLRLERARVAEASGDLDTSAADYEHLLRRDSGNDAVHDIALSELIFQKKVFVRWEGLPELQAAFRNRALAEARSGAPSALTPFSFLSDPSTRAEQCALARAHARSFARAPRPTRALSSGPLKIGYLSADFHEHATGILAAGLFEHHDRRRFEVHAYSTGPDDGSVLRTRLVAGFDRFVDTRGWPDAAVARRIADDGIDLLVDLKGHTERAATGVMALRPAPIAVSYLGYPGTMGAPFIDYLIGDRIVTPLADADDYDETIVQLPHAYQITDDRRVVPAAASRAEHGLPDGAPVLCCFNQSYKINADVVDAWGDILRAVPEAVLWLLAPRSDAGIASRLAAHFAARGVAAERIVFAAKRPHAAYLALYRCADLFLDTWPYNAHTTASDALWAGCPLVTRAGTTFAGRVGASLLAAAGLGGMVAPDRATYVARVVELARDRPRLAALRTSLEASVARSPLFDTAATTRAIERAYLAMSVQYREGRKSPILVDGDERSD